jgi:hypothetical protein
MTFNDPVEMVLEALRAHGCDPKKNGQGWKAFCPSHERDGEPHTPSLSVGTNDRGDALVCCHAGCALEEITKSIGKEPRDLFAGNGRAHPTKRTTPSKPTRSFATKQAAIDALLSWSTYRGGRVSEYPYPPSTAIKLRCDFSDGRKKEFVWLHESGGAWKMTKPQGKLPPYGAIALATDGPLYSPEGEKDTDAAGSLGLSAFTSGFGCNAETATDWGPYIAGRDIIIVADAHTPGVEHAYRKAQIFHDLGCKVKLIEALPGVPDGGSVSDFVELHDSAESDDLRRQIEAIVEETPRWFPPVPAEASDAAVALPEWRPFPVECLPEPIRSLAREGATALGCDPSMIALPVLSVCAAAIGTTRQVRLKRTWTEPPVIWSAVIARSATLKTPAHDLAVRPLLKAQENQFRAFESASREYETDRLHYDTELSEWKRSKRTRDRLASPPQAPSAPVCVRHLVSDCTLEALAPILSGNPRGLLVARDELSGWLGSFNEYKSKGSDVPNWLQLHRAGTIVVDRKSAAQKTIYVPRAAVSICGTIQPGTIRRALTTEFFECGLAARLLIAEPPIKPKRWREAELPERVERDYAATLLRLLSLSQEPGRDGELRPVDVELSPEAKRLWVTFYNEFADDQSNAGSDDLAAVFGKLEAYAARFALVLALVAAPDSRAIDAESVRAGIGLAKWFASEAERMYAIFAESDEGRERSTLIGWIRDHGGTVAVRDLQAGNRQYRNSGDAEAALAGLAAAGIGRFDYVRTDGRQRREFRLAVNVSPAGATVSKACADVDSADTPKSNGRADVPSGWSEGSWKAACSAETHGEPADCENWAE